jgi:hypothetical protein
MLRISCPFGAFAMLRLSTGQAVTAHPLGRAIHLRSEV